MQAAFLGLGTMGAPMAANLAKAGVALRVWNRSEGPAARLAEFGAEPAASPAEAARGTDVLIAMLADDAATSAVLLDGGALEALAPGALLVNMATVAVAVGASLAAQAESRGVAYVAAPVLGRVNVAEAGELNILAGGRADAINRAQPLFDVMGRKTWRFGDRPEQANAVKLAVNFMLASAIETMGEAASLAEGHGVAGADFLAMATSTVFAAPAYQGYGAAIASETFEPAGFKLSLGLKDVRLALEAAEAARTPMPFAAVLRDNLIDAVAHGEGDLDWAALAKVAARRAGRI
ncbi:NAD(P)-dependent oxidoreductase [Methylopila sp. Yamaguchi]|uniref:NAD(P)-dependent oxidoreductase n=1 Tax=Methylopila sp. Yamaguchi TaxID=1437817 RepID=UPI000CB52D45|nr:NAD(P)-dependent oxidoreductase [Methylopila sp. Yamaguchi]GBD46867.1 dehydrogenase [Methylopila sp. Yamaguchi]